MGKGGQENFPFKREHSTVAWLPSLAVSANNKKPEPVFQKLVLRHSARVAS